MFDYIHAVSNYEDLKPDLILALISLLWPEFHEHKEKVFLKEEFTQSRYDKLRSNFEYSINSLALSEMFSSVNFETQKLIGNKIVEAWSAKLKLDFPKMNFTVLCEEDDPEDLWCSFFQTES